MAEMDPEIRRVGWSTPPEDADWEVPTQTYVFGSNRWMPVGQSNGIKFSDIHWLSPCRDCGHNWSEALVGWGCLNGWEFDDDGIEVVSGCPCKKWDDNDSMKD